MYYDKFLLLCGYEPDEITVQRARIEKAFNKLEFTPNDFEIGEQRVRLYYDVELRSVRKMLGIWIQSLVDLILAREEGKKIVYTSMPPYFHILNGLAIISKDVYVTSPDITLATAVGGIFGKLLPFLEEAEGDILPAGCAFCSPIQAKLGAINRGVIPLPDLLISSGFVCDQTPKLDEILNARYGTPVIYADGTHDEYEKLWPQVSQRRVKYIAQESAEILEELKKILGCSLSEEIARKADLNNSIIGKQCHRIFNLLKDTDPLPTSFVNVGMIMRLAKLSVNSTTALADMESLLNLFYSELQDRINHGKGNGPKGKPRVGISGLASIPEPTRMIEDSGLAIVADFTGLAPTGAELINSRYEDYWERSAETVLRYCSGKYAIRLMHLCKEWNLDGAVLNPPIGCRDLCKVALKEKDLILKELGIPGLILECDLADSRSYNAEALRTRLEAFAEMLRSNKAAKAK